MEEEMIFEEQMREESAANESAADESAAVSMSCWSNRPVTMHTWRKANPNPKVKLSLSIMETPWRYLI